MVGGDAKGNDKAFVEWAKHEAIDLTMSEKFDDLDALGFLDETVGDTRVVAMGESAHYLHEWNLIRTRLFQYLVLNHGFTTFVLESGLVEGRVIHDYVAGADISWDDVVNAVTNGWGVWGEIQEMIRWMRDYNDTAAPDRKLRFYGTDGSGNWSHIRHVYTAVAAYASEVDDAFARDVVRDFEAAARDITFEQRGQIDATTWRGLIAKCGLLVSRMEQSRIEFIAASSTDAYDWALRYACILRDQILNMAQTDPDFAIGFRSFWNIRDAAMADQLEWIIRREGPGARIVIGAHNTHLQQVPVRVQKATSMGSYLASRIGRDNILFIGAASAMSVKGDPPQGGSNQAAYEQVGPDCFFLDLRRAPARGPVADWLRTERMDRSNLRYQPVAPGRAWDCLIFHRTLSIADVALPKSLHVGRGTDDPSQFDDYVGRYILIGFLAAPTTLDISRDGDTLYADGHADTSGELFPPFKTPLHASDDGRFLWPNWPAVLEFRGEGRTDRISLTMPGMGIYEGARAEP